VIKIWYLIVVTAWPPHAAPERQEVPISLGEPGCRAVAAQLTETFSRVKDKDFYWRIDCESRLQPKPKKAK